MADLPLVHNGQPHKSESQQQRPTLLARWFDDWWLGELIAVLLSCALVAALCAVLKMYDCQPVPTFATSIHGGMTLGTLVSLLVNLSVATALSVVQACTSQLKWLWYTNKSRPLGDIETYDRASRGLMGSLLLLWKLRMTPTASFGALLIISQLAILPLAQQSLLYHSVPINATSEHGTVPVTRDWLEAGQQSQTTKMPLGYDSLSTGMKGAILNGIFAGVDVAINDISGFLCISCGYIFASPEHHEEEFRQLCLPNGICPSDSKNSMQIMMKVISAANNVDSEKNSSAGEPLNYTSIAFADHVTPVGDFYMFYKIPDNRGQYHWGAVEFVIDWCIRTLSTQVTNGTAVTKQPSQPFMAFDAQSGYTITGRPDGGGAGDPNTFTIDRPTHYTLQRHMALTLSGSVYLQVGNPYSDSDVVQELGSLYQLDGQTVNLNFTSAMGLAALSSLLGNVATSMTNYVRTTTFHDAAIGTVWTQQLVVRVDWQFLAAPIVFSAASVLFFLVVVVLGSGGGGDSGQKGRAAVKPPLWKSSAVPAMRCLDPALHHDLGGPPGRKTSLEADEQQHVRLIREGDGWLLVR